MTNNRSHRTLTKNDAGFTLVELLVVISIIAVLGALVLSGGQVAISRTKSSKCLSNLRQIYLVSIQYANENNGDIVSSIGLNPSVDPIHSMSWDLMLQRFSGISSIAGVRPPGIYACPASTNLVTNPGSSSSDYGKNVFINGDYRTATVNYRMVNLSKPSEFILFGDGGRDLWGPNPPYNLVARHKGLANIIYADGHAVAINPTNFPSSVSPGPPWRP